MLDCPLVKKDLPKLQGMIKANAEAQKHLAALGFDPLKDLDSVTIGAAGVEDQDQVVIVARGKFDAAKFKAAAELLGHEIIDDMKAQPGAAFAPAGGEKRIERLPQDIRRHADAIVPERDFDVVGAAWPRRDADRARRSLGKSLVGRVKEQVRQNLAV